MTYDQNRMREVAGLPPLEEAKKKWPYTKLQAKLRKISKLTDGPAWRSRPANLKMGPFAERATQIETLMNEVVDDLRALAPTVDAWEGERLAKLADGFERKIKENGTSGHAAGMQHDASRAFLGGSNLSSLAHTLEGGIEKDWRKRYEE